MLTDALAALSLALATLGANPPDGLVTDWQSHSYRDWSVACDNVQSCTAVNGSAEMVERQRASDPGDLAEPRLWVRRNAGPDSAPRLAIDLAVFGEPQSAGPLTLHVMHLGADGRSEILGRAYRLTETEPGLYTLERNQIAGFLAESRYSAVAYTRHAGGDLHGLISTSGLSAALRHIDAAQGRTGHRSALMPDPRPTSRRVPPAPNSPEVRIVRGSSRDPYQTPAPERLDDLAGAACGNAGADGEPAAQAWRLTDGTRLWRMPCGGDARNALSLWLVEDRAGTISLQPFARPDTAQGRQQAILANATYDPASGILTEFYQIRMFGDCGWQRRWAWDGRRFAMIDTIEMPACLGIARHQWLLTWRAVPQ